MKNKHLLSIASLLTISFTAAHAQTIVDWDFDKIGTEAAPYNSPAPYIGSGTATVLGMNNDYNDGTSASLPYADITATAGASTGSGSYGWRIRGGSVSGGTGTPNGWSTNAPIATQGAEFATSTAGYYDLQVSFDLYTTSQAEADVAFLYTLNDTAANPTWTVGAMSYSGSMTTTLQNNTSNPLLINGSYLQLGTAAGGWYNDITVNLGDVADNDPNFAFEIVNAATGTADINQTDGVYNNNSGNWRFDNVDVTVVPEPGTLALAGLGGLISLIGLRKSRKA